MNKLIAANWKMNKTSEEAVSYIEELKKNLKKEKDADVVICSPFTALESLSKELKGTNISLGAQNMHFENQGAFTGEISPLMLKNLNCKFVILGHSERRELFDEDDFLINKKIFSALANEIAPILCVGENIEQRNNGKTKEAIEKQLGECLRNINKNQMLRINIAYEPVWAISKGNPNHKAATAKDAEQGHKIIRSFLSNLFDEDTAKNTRIIYGGSMKPENAKELLSMPNINGGLVGNASLNARSFAEIVNSV